MKTAVGFISEKLKGEFESLKEGKYEDKQLYSFIDRALDDLKENPECGVKVPKGYWPKEYTKGYGVLNLWKYNLPNAWRLVYTLESDGVKIVSIVLEWFNHDDYEKRFGY